MTTIPACAQKCYNGDQPSYGCNFIDTACYCKQSVATQLVRCAQGNCDQTDLQSFTGWAQEACAAVGVSFEATSSGTTAQSQAIASPTMTSQASNAASSKATVPTSDAGSGSSGGLSVSDEIAIGVGVGGGLIAILTLWVTWKMYQRNKDKSRKQVSIEL